MKNKVTFDDKQKTVEYYLGPVGPIKIDLSKILGIGEFTTSGGPLSDDYNLVLITPSFWFAIPMDSEGMTAFIKWMEVEFKTEIRPALANSVVEKSRMIYPARLKEKEFLKSEFYKPRNWIDSLKVRLGIKPGKILKLHADISEILKCGI